MLKSNQKEKTTIQNIDFLQLYLNEVHIPFVISFGRFFFSPFLKLMCYLISIQMLLNLRKFPQMKWLLIIQENVYSLIWLFFPQTAVPVLQMIQLYCMVSLQGCLNQCHSCCILHTVPFVSQKIQPHCFYPSSYRHQILI